MKKLALFDIDETLITTKPSGFSNSHFFHAIKKVYGIETDHDKLNTHGMTDPQIIVEILKLNGMSEEEINVKLHECLENLVDCFLKNSDKYKLIVFDGVIDILDELENKGVLLGLLTGNVEEIAKSKIGNLTRYFRLGGFGSDDPNRTNLIRIAIKRAEENFNFIFDDNVFIFDDSLRGIKAGNSAGIKTVGVATGAFSKNQLKEAGADYTIENWKDKNSVLEILNL